MENLVGFQFSPEYSRPFVNAPGWVVGKMGIGYAILAFVVVFAVTAGVAILVFWLDPVSRRLRATGGATAETPGDMSVFRWGDPAKRVPQWRRTLEKLGQAFLGRAPETGGARYSSLRGRLVWAGFDNPMSVPLFVGVKVVMALGLAYSYVLYGLMVQRVLPNILLSSLVLGVIGFFLPDFWLSQRVKERKRLISNALPDVLDLLVVCVEAGMGLDAAVAKVTDPDVVPAPTALHKEMRRMHLEFRAGRPRTEALHALGERTGVDDLRKIVAAFIQTEKLGTSLANTLRVHAEASRIARRLRAEKQAQLAPVKMLFPIVFFLMPAFMIVMLMPPMLKIAAFFGGGMH